MHVANICAVIDTLIGEDADQIESSFIKKGFSMQATFYLKNLQMKTFSVGSSDDMPCIHHERALLFQGPLLSGSCAHDTELILDILIMHHLCTMILQS